MNTKVALPAQFVPHKTTKMKKYLLLLLNISVSIVLLAQSSLPARQAPQYKKHRGDLLQRIDFALSTALPLGDTSKEINGLFFIRFNVDLKGNVANIAFSNESYSQKDGLEVEGVDSVDRKRLNRLIESELIKTNGQWIPGQVNGKPSQDIAILIVVSCSVYRPKVNRRPGSGRITLYSNPDFGSKFSKDEPYVVFGTVQWSGQYKQ